MAARKYEVGISGDYATMTAGQLGFYVGYEATICPEHGNDAGCDCDKEEWAFTVDDGGHEIQRIPLSELGDAGDSMAELLLRGISQFGAQRWKD